MNIADYAGFELVSRIPIYTPVTLEYPLIRPLKNGICETISNTVQLENRCKKKTCPQLYLLQRRRKALSGGNHSKKRCTGKSALVIVVSGTFDCSRLNLELDRCYRASPRGDMPQID